VFEPPAPNHVAHILPSIFNVHAEGVEFLVQLPVDRGRSLVDDTQDPVGILVRSLRDGAETVSEETNDETKTA
jgi:hypothetical protein